jgi:hypothetical protein
MMCFRTNFEIRTIRPNNNYLQVFGLQLDDNLLSHMRQKVARRPAMSLLVKPGRIRENMRDKILAHTLILTYCGAMNVRTSCPRF